MSIYLLLKSLHIIAIIAWMAGLLYLPRIYVYHCQTTFGSEAHEKFVQMEYRLLKYIMNPAMIISWILGIGLIHSLGHEVATQFWLQLKLFLVLLMSGFHGYLGAQCPVLFAALTTPLPVPTRFNGRRAKTLKTKATPTTFFPSLPMQRRALAACSTPLNL